MTPELRHLRAFLAVARHLNFTRAAAELGVAQPALSQTIRALERHLGVSLFVRTTRVVALTDIGHTLMQNLSPAVRAIDQTLHAAHSRAADAPAVLRVAFHAGGVGPLLTEVLHAFSAANPHASIDLRRLDWTPELDCLRDGTADVALVRPPVRTTGLHTTVLLRDHRIVGMATGHRLSRLPRVHIDDLADEPVIHGAEAPDELQDYWTINPRPNGRPPVLGPAVRTNDEMLEHVALGTAVCIAAATIRHHYIRPDITFRPIHGIAPTPLLLVATTPATALARQFIDIARTVQDQLHGGW